MSRRLMRVAVVVLALAGARVAAAQQPPTTDQARRLLETRPELVAQLRREIAGSGMTPDQIRARLRAAGYPEDLLDGYIPPRRGGIGARDTTALPLPTEDILDAVAALGMSDSVDTSELRSILRGRRAGMDSLALRPSRSAFDDTLIRRDADLDRASATVDSLGRVVPVARRGSLRPIGVPAADSGFAIFGLNVFRAATTQFDPNLAGPVDPGYRLGPGDRLVLIITGDAERASTLDVTREGFIIVPGVGEVPAANLTLGQLEDQLYARLGRVFSGLHRGPGATTHFSLNLARLRTSQVTVLGDVEQPGSYRISSLGTAMSALYAAGGPTANGGMRRVEVRRGGRVVDTLDLYDYLLRADGSHDPRLQSGDVVFVPVHGPRVRVFGEILRPGSYELRRGETLGDLFRAAGGLTPEAVTRRVQISRILPAAQRDTTDRARVVLDVALEQGSAGLSGVTLEAGDAVRVFRVSDRVGRRVTVRGNVGTQGTVGFTPGMRLSDALRLAGGLKPDTYLGEVLVSRLRGADSVRTQLRTSFRDGGRPVEDLALQDDDEVRVFSITELRSVEYVAITGAVRRPGRFAYREGMTLRDLVLLAGGMEDRASVREAEIARLPRTREGGRLATSQRVPLDSSYLFAARSSASSGVMQAGSARDVTLEPFDNVLILAEPGWDRARRVTVTGEVQSPGTYTLLAKTDRIADVIQRAGGLTAAAYPGGVVFYRHAGRMGRIGVDLARALHDPEYVDNLLLQDGDSIHLPSFSGVVEVQGAVNAPRGVAWVKGKNLDYYVRAAGGPSKLAEMDRAYVTQPDGRVESVRARRFWPNDVPVPLPGSVVLVTDRDQIDHTDPVARLAVVAQILGGLVALVAIMRQR